MDVSLCLDNDEAGQTAARKIQTAFANISPDIAATINPPERGQDYNELLQAITLERRQQRADRHKAVGVSL
jgi:DNA primase